MKTIEIEYAILQHFGVRRNIIVTNVSWGVVHDLHECDVLVLSKSGYATEVEIKVSKQDILKDKEKTHGHRHRYIRRLYFAVPEKLYEFAIDHIPKNSGLLIVKKVGGRYRVLQKRKAKIKSSAHKWDEKEVMNLARLGTMRAEKYLKKIIELTTKIC